jgi:iron complex transport system ATP-binding protein
MIDVSRLSFSYRRSQAVLSEVAFKLEKGQTLSILGPNGCGKTTLLKAILGFLPIEKKTIFINGAPLESYSRDSLARILSYVPQLHGQAFPFKVRDIALMGRTGRRKWGGFDKKDQASADLALERVGVAHLAQRPVTELSGGQRQLVVIARALAQNSEFVLMDEPTSGLDLSNQAMVLKTMRRLHEEEGLSFLMTTHHPEQAFYLGGQVLMVKDGRVIRWGPAQKITTTETVEELYNLEPGLLRRMGLIPSCLGQA